MSDTHIALTSIGSKLILRVAILWLIIGATQSSPAQTLTILHSFVGGTGDGAEPSTGVVLDSQGNVYGATWAGGNRGGDGTVYEVTPEGVETVLHSFSSGAYAYPNSLVSNGEGDLYGLTSGSGSCEPIYGAAFEIDEAGAERTIFNFSRAGLCNPNAGLVMDPQGNLYGTVEDSVFKLTPSKKGKQDTLTILYAFPSCADGCVPRGNLVFDAQGNLYGTTVNGGSGTKCEQGPGCGVVFRLTPDGSETVLYSFTGGTDGAYPWGGVILDGQGNLYGTTTAGGDLSCYFSNGYGCGTVFKIAPDGSETVLYSFTDEADGAYPHAGVIQDARGNLYGTAPSGGDSDPRSGTVFELTKGGRLKVLHSFNGTDGAYPYAGLVFDALGNLYGTTEYGGGDCNCGTLFKLTP